MSLRDIQITVPKFTAVMPSTKKKVKFRAFNVGDEKALLMASESKDQRQMIQAIKDVLGNCVEGVKVDDMAPYDIEYLFLKLRSVSAGEKATIGMTCPACNHMNKVDVDISNVEVFFPDGHNRVIRMNTELGFEMKYPDMEAAAEMSQNPDSVMRVIAMSIKCVYHGEEVIDASQEPIEDVIDLLEQLPSKQFNDVQKFFETIPKLTKEISYDCHNCKQHNEVKLEGIADFF